MLKQLVIRSDENFTKLVAVKYDDSIAKASLKRLSISAFGNTLGVYDNMGRLTPVTETEVREHADANNMTINAASMGGIIIIPASAINIYHFLRMC